MKTRIEKLLKEKIGTSFVHDDTKGFNVFALRGYGRGVLIVYDNELKDVKYTKVIYPSMKHFSVNLEQDQEHYDDILVASVKMMIDLRKKFEVVK